MKKYALSNLLFTITFLLIFSPLFFLLYQYVLSYEMPSVPAKKSLNELNISSISINRDFSSMMEHTDKTTVLMYHQIIPEKHLKKHHFTDTGELIDMIITLEDFTEQMNYLKDNNYTVLSLKEFELFMINEKKVPEKSILITFDDGYKNIFEFAYPVLKSHGFYATHFIITGVITNKSIAYDSSYLQYASIDEVKEATDVFDYGNHTHSFHKRNDNGVSYLEAYDLEKVKEDLATANEWLGHSIAFAAPFGEYNTSTLNILRDLNMKMAFTTDPGYAEPSQHLLEIPRQAIYPFYTMEDFIYIIEQKVDYSH
ncbi:MAG: polysaccharide deacetylase family protein [Solibacillus sp.]